jgi:hypothetical protein
MIRKLSIICFVCLWSTSKAFAQLPVDSISTVLYRNASISYRILDRCLDKISSGELGKRVVTLIRSDVFYEIIREKYKDKAKDFQSIENYNLIVRKLNHLKSVNGAGGGTALINGDQAIRVLITMLQAFQAASGVLDLEISTSGLRQAPQLAISGSFGKSKELKGVVEKLDSIINILIKKGTPPVERDTSMVEITRVEKDKGRLSTKVVFGGVISEAHVHWDSTVRMVFIDSVWNAPQPIIDSANIPEENPDWRYAFSVLGSDANFLGGFASYRIKSSGSFAVSAGVSGKGKDNLVIYGGIGRLAKCLLLEAGPVLYKKGPQDAKFRIQGLVRMSIALSPWEDTHFHFLPGLFYSPATGVGVSIGVGYR